MESGDRQSWRLAMPLSRSLGQLALRNIAWSEWDPMALNGSEGGWRFSDAANEYDRYILRVLEGLQSGEPEASMIDYLVGIETHHMGLCRRPTRGRERERQLRPFTSGGGGRRGLGYRRRSIGPARDHCVRKDGPSISTRCIESSRKVTHASKRFWMSAITSGSKSACSPEAMPRPW